MTAVLEPGHMLWLDLNDRSHVRDYTNTHSNGGAVREPNFFIVGAARSGTTSLWQYLRQHPDVFMPDSMTTKEPSHFCYPTPPWATAFRERDSYLRLFSGAGAKSAVGEASASYLGRPGCAKRIHDSYPDARIIITLRQPARRTFSLYRHNCMMGLEWLPTFERALAAEEERYNDETLKRDTPFWHMAYCYFRASLYADQVAEYTDLFPREQIHFVVFDDLKDRPVETTQAIYEFLGVDPGFTPIVKVHFDSLVPGSIRLQHWLCQHWDPFHPPAARSGMIDRTLLPMLFDVNLLVGKTMRRTSLQPETERRLID